MLTASSLLTELQGFLHRRGIDAEALTARPMVDVMIDWFRLAPVGLASGDSPADVLIYRYGGWSEGCATGFKLSLLRKVTEADAEGRATDWYAGITLMFEPSRLGHLTPFSTVSTDWPSLEAFLHAIESSPAFRLTSKDTPMGVVVESGGLR